MYLKYARLCIHFCMGLYVHVWYHVYAYMSTTISMLMHTCACGSTFVYMYTHMHTCALVTPIPTHKYLHTRAICVRISMGIYALTEPLGYRLWTWIDFIVSTLA